VSEYTRSDRSDLNPTRLPKIQPDIITADRSTVVDPRQLHNLKLHLTLGYSSKLVNKTDPLEFEFSFSGHISAIWSLIPAISRHWTRDNQSYTSTSITRILRSNTILSRYNSNSSSFIYKSNITLSLILSILIVVHNKIASCVILLPYNPLASLLLV